MHDPRSWLQGFDSFPSVSSTTIRLAVSFVRGVGWDSKNGTQSFLYGDHFML